MDNTNPSPLRTVLTIASAIGFIAYPLVVYLGLSQWSPRIASLVLLALFAPLVLPRLARLSRSDLTTVAMIPLITLALLATGALFARAELVLVEPVAVNLVMLGVFGATFGSERPMVERFARMQHPDLTEDEVAWCRLWTWLWCGFFAANAVIAGVLALWATLKVWAIYNGLIFYACMALMFGVEFVIRKLRFRRWGDNPVDRLFERIARRLFAEDS